MLHGILVILHVFVSVFLIVTVLLQSGKGGGLAGTFGGSGVTGGVFGGRGAAPFLAKATTVFAVMFMLTAITLNFVTPGVRDGGSVIERVAPVAPPIYSEPAVTDEMPSVPPQSESAPQNQFEGGQE